MQHIVCWNQITGNDIGLLKYFVYFRRTLVQSFCYATNGKRNKFQYILIHSQYISYNI